MCNGTSAQIIAALSCQVDYTELRNTFGLLLGDSIVFVVKAKNAIGWGPLSTINSVQDIVRTEPLMPLSVVQEGSLTNDF